VGSVSAATSKTFEYAPKPIPFIQASLNFKVDPLGKIYWLTNVNDNTIPCSAGLLTIFQSATPLFPVIMLLSNSTTYDITPSPPVSMKERTGAHVKLTVLGVTKAASGTGAKVGTESVITLYISEKAPIPTPFLARNLNT
jgi:hypothetical protein